MISDQTYLQVIDRVHMGENVTTIAQSIGIGKTKLYANLLEFSPEPWKAAQAGIALSRLEDAQQDLQNVDPQSSTANAEIAHARERIKSAQWQLERVCKRIYGQSIQLDLIVVDVRVAIAEARERAGRTIEHDAEQQPAQITGSSE